jgi:hypothetical protein
MLDPLQVTSLRYDLRFPWYIALHLPICWVRREEDLLYVGTFWETCVDFDVPVYTHSAVLEGIVKEKTALRKTPIPQPPTTLT